MWVPGDVEGISAGSDGAGSSRIGGRAVTPVDRRDEVRCRRSPGRSRVKLATTTLFRVCPAVPVIVTAVPVGGLAGLVTLTVWKLT